MPYLSLSFAWPALLTGFVSCTISCRPFRGSADKPAKVTSRAFRVHEATQARRCTSLLGGCAFAGECTKSCLNPKAGLHHKDCPNAGESQRQRLDSWGMSPDLDAMGFGDEQDVLRVCKVQAVWRGHSLRKKQWLDAQWMSRRGIRDSRTRFWSTHHGVRAREHGWADQDMHIVEAAADALRMGLPLRDFTKDLEVYSLCFSGCEAVEFLRKWLHENGHPFTHSDAASLCARFLKGRFIASVEITDGAEFANRFDPGFALYAFTGMASPMLSRWRCAGSSRCSSSTRC